MTQEAATPRGFWEQVRRIAQGEVAKAMRSGSVRNSSVSAGGQFTIRNGALVVESDAGQTSAFFGGIYPATPDGKRQPGFILYREDGSKAAAMYDPAPGPTPSDYKQFFALYDRDGNIVLSDDTETGLGLARPYVPFFFYSARFTDTPQVTSSATFETLWLATAYKQNPISYVAAASVASAGTTGEVRVLVNGVQLGTTQSVTSTSAAHAFGPSLVTGDAFSTLTVQIQARVTSGAGSLRILPQMGTGFQS